MVLDTAERKTSSEAERPREIVVRVFLAGELLAEGVVAGPLVAMRPAPRPKPEKGAR